MRTKLSVMIAGLGLLLAAVPVLAHHSFAAEFDAKKPVKLSGTVTKMEWINPHAWIYIDVKNTDGTVTNWMVEAGAPNALLRRGWTKNSLLPGHRDRHRRLSGEGRREPRQRPRYHLQGRQEALRRLPGHWRAGRTQGIAARRTVA